MAKTEIFKIIAAWLAMQKAAIVFLPSHD